MEPEVSLQWSQEPIQMKPIHIAATYFFKDAF
jgi:hypothetical protein